ncbi:hypothetical protein O6H91_03G101500 [Diphasiastrum complanatum]|uniref:Uncharacterized protein n=1 Tax=Diphasiastrum complanatum TaxID=34168 RepID=A0ACC2EAC0_DIPCM|nr:hypothetical protein O6H91_03G101500 [Diphasiastrum complanatum]
MQACAYLPPPSSILIVMNSAMELDDSNNHQRSHQANDKGNARLEVIQHDENGECVELVLSKAFDDRAQEFIKTEKDSAEDEHVIISDSAQLEQKAKLPALESCAKTARIDKSEDHDSQMMSLQPQLEGLDSETELSSHISGIDKRLPKRRDDDKQLPKAQIECNYNVLSDFDAHNESPEIPCKQYQKSKERRRPSRESFDFVVTVDPPTKLMGQFLKLQKEYGHSFDVADTDIEELSKSGGITDWPFVSAENNYCLTDMLSVSEHSERSFDGSSVSKGRRLGDSDGVMLLRDAVDCDFDSATVSQNQSPAWLRDIDAIIDPKKSSKPTAEASGEPMDEELFTNKGMLHLRRRFCKSESNSATFSDEVLKTSTISSGRKSYSYQLKRKSRLLDPGRSSYEALPRSPQSSGHLGVGKPSNSSMSQRSNFHISGPALAKVEEEEDDPLKDADLPAECWSNKWDIWSALEWAVFIALVAALMCSIVVPFLKRRMIWGLEVWKWAVLVLVVFCGCLVSGWLVRILVFCIERNFLLRKRVLYFVYGLRKGVRNCLWLVCVLLAWRFLFDTSVEQSSRSYKAVTYVTNLLLCFLIATIIWLLKILGVKILASSFHVSTYFERIQDSLFNQYILETLSGPPLIATHRSFNGQLNDQLTEAGAKPTGHLSGHHVAPRQSGLLSRSGLLGSKRQAWREGKSGAKDGKGQKEDDITIERLQRLSQNNVSAWNMKRLIKLVRYTGVSTLSHSLDSSMSELEGSDNEIQTEWQAKAAAQKIFKNVANPGKRCIVLKDLMRFLTAEETRRAVGLFEGATETGRITKHSLKNWVVCL